MVLIIWIVAGFMLLVCSVGVFALLHFMRRNRTRYEQVGGAKQCDVADLSNGMRKIKGRIVAQDELLISPLTRGRCVFYRFKVEEQRTETTNHGGRTGTRTYWHTIINDVDAIPITVEDNTGEAAVKLRDAE